MAKKILIIEDEKFLSEMYKMKFEKEGYEVSIAMDGIDGLEILKKWTPDLILLDLVMPRMDGFKFLDEIKKNKKTQGIKVCIFSNLTQNNEMKICQEKGADSFLLKASQTPSQLLSFIENLLSQKTEKKNIEKVEEIKAPAKNKTKAPEVGKKDLI